MALPMRPALDNDQHTAPPRTDMEPGKTALVALFSVGAVLAIAAISTHIYEWRHIRMKRRLKAKEDLEKSEAATSDIKSPRSAYPTSRLNEKQTVPSTAPGKKPDILSPGWVPLASPQSALSTTSPCQPRSANSDVLHISNVISPTTVQVTSPISPQSLPSPITPLSPVYSPVHGVSSTYQRSSDVRPLLLRDAADTSYQAEIKIARPAASLRVAGGRVRRFATPPRHLKLVASNNLAVSKVSGSLRRQFSARNTEKRPCIVARSVQELVGPQPFDDHATIRLVEPNVQMNARTGNMDEVGRYGW